MRPRFLARLMLVAGLVVASITLLRSMMRPGAAARSIELPAQPAAIITDTPGLTSSPRSRR